MKKINFKKWNIFKQKPKRSAASRPTYGRPMPPRHIGSNTIYRYKYLKSFIMKVLITIVAIIFLVLFKKTNFKPTNKVLEIIKHNIQYKVDIKKDSKRIYHNVERLVNKSIDSITVFNTNKVEKLLAPISGTLYKSYIIDLDDNINDNSGIDILADNNLENPKAIIEGKVKSVEIKGSKGYFVTIEGNDMELVYGYLSKSFVGKDEKVSIGDEIGIIGTNKDGLKYLRFEVYLKGKPVNPLDYIELDWTPEKSGVLI